VAKKQMDWARRLRRKIMRELGDVCNGYNKKCNVVRKLQFDCIKPVGNSHGKWSYDTRVRFYREQHKLNNLQILCSRCHERKSAEERKHNANHPEFNYDDDNTPF
jgi:hypothetical protein